MRRDPIPAFAEHCAHGAGVGLLFGATLLLSNTAGLGALAFASPQLATTLIFLIGAMFAFAPVVLCSVLAMALADPKVCEQPPNRSLRTTRG